MSEFKIANNLFFEDADPSTLRQRTLTSGLDALIRDLFDVPDDAYKIDVRVFTNGSNFESGVSIDLRHDRIAVRWEQPVVQQE